MVTDDEILVILARALIEEAAKSATWLWRSFRRRIELPGERKEILSSFLLGNGEYLLHPGADWQPAPGQAPAPWAPQGYPHEVMALEKFVDLLPPLTYYDQKTLLFETKVKPTSKIFCSGSPKSNALTRKFIPYYQISLSEVSLLYKTTIKPESITYCYGEDLTSDSVNVISMMRGKIPDKKTQKVIFRRTSDGAIRPWVPKDDKKEGWLKKDFLIVSRLPRNKIGGDVTIFAGGHGAGTEATGLFLWELPIKQLRDLSDAIGSAPYYQFVIEVDEVEHNTEVGTIPKRVHLSEEMSPVVLQTIEMT